MMTRRDQLIRDIEDAFADVERANGLTLHEAAEFEATDYCTAEERERVRALNLGASPAHSPYAPLSFPLTPFTLGQSYG